MFRALDAIFTLIIPSYADFLATLRAADVFTPRRQPPII